MWCLTVFKHNCLYIAAHPFFTHKPLNSIFLISGENATIECNASGIPQPVVKWIRRSSPPPNGSQHDNGGVLKISNAQPQDSVDYECVASNKRGVIRANTKLVVPRPGELTFYPLRVKVRTGSISTFLMKRGNMGKPKTRSNAFGNRFNAFESRLNAFAFLTIPPFHQEGHM